MLFEVKCLQAALLSEEKQDAKQHFQVCQCVKKGGKEYKYICVCSQTVKWFTTNDRLSLMEAGDR